MGPRALPVARGRAAWYIVVVYPAGPVTEGGKRLTKVIVEPDESFESALKRFKKQCEKAGLLSEFKKRQHYEKPSVRRKRKALAARKKAKRRERMSD
jgi:small subunit ribosomal protein S21